MFFHKLFTVSREKGWQSLDVAGMEDEKGSKGKEIIHPSTSVFIGWPMSNRRNCYRKSISALFCSGVVSSRR